MNVQLPLIILYLIPFSQKTSPTQLYIFPLPRPIYLPSSNSQFQCTKIFYFKNPQNYKLFHWACDLCCPNNIQGKHASKE